ncbi:MAG: DNA mismatch repair endonuclease MutL [Spirochaetales bacterium]|nr:DNA mismatch repair endonuclease MutL [Spirochaetales bacterium]
MNQSRIALLEDSVARRIAAGEVIERPASVVRELLDNSIDAGGQEIALHIEGGGIDRIRIVDNGTGMTGEELDLCWLPHATSKIRTVEDLDQVGTLGFRGEALSSVAACARMEIVSATDENGSAERLLIQGGRKVLREGTGGTKGTVIDVADLFYSIPARKKFLKRASAEAQQCRKTFLEKALPFPHVGFRFFQDGKLSLYLPPSDLKKRVLSGYPTLGDEKLFTHLSYEDEGFSVDIVAGGPELHRRNRQQIHIFANNRRIDEYAFVQAVEYGYDTFLPGGQFPICFVFIHADPKLVDFNIHPAKREAKFRIKQEIHHRIVVMIKESLNRHHTSLDRPALEDIGKVTARREETVQAEFAPFQARERAEYGLSAPGGSQGYIARERTAVAKSAQSFTLPRENSAPFAANRTTPEPEQPARDFRYLGQFMNLFLLIERGNKLYIMDQHAAHERVLFEDFKNNQSHPQELLIPIKLELTDDEEEWLKKSQSDWKKLGFDLQKHGRGDWTINRVPAFAGKLDEEILGIIRGKGGTGDRLEKDLYAQASCKAAIKDGEVLDRETAIRLIEKAFLLPFPRCPHGRPLWFEISREELFQLVGRTV